MTSEYPLGSATRPAGFHWSGVPAAFNDSHAAYLSPARRTKSHGAIGDEPRTSSMSGVRSDGPVGLRTVGSFSTTGAWTTAATCAGGTGGGASDGSSGNVGRTLISAG